jgi:hypothetical protein
MQASDLTDSERQTLANFLALPSSVRTAIGKFAGHQRQHYERMAAESLRTLPRQLEAACDQAAKAEVYATLLNELQRFADK